MEQVLVEVFGVEQRLSAATADAAYDQIAAKLERDDFRPLELLDRFGIEILATTDSPSSDLAHHAALYRRGWADRIVPTFRTDTLLAVDDPGWPDEMAHLSETSGIDVHDYRSYIAAIEQRRGAFVAAGGRATDHGTSFWTTEALDADDAVRIVDRALRGEAIAAEAEAFAGHMINEMARMSTQDGLVMQLHPGALRDHDPQVLATYGRDVGYDVPVAVEFTRMLRPLLSRWGHHPSFRLVLFTLDEALDVAESLASRLPRAAYTRP